MKPWTVLTHLSFEELPLIFHHRRTDCTSRTMATPSKRKFNNKLGGSFSVVRSNGSSNQTTLTNWDDMIACGMPKASVEDAYQREFGKKPDAVHLNDDFCKNYGWLSYNLLGATSYSNVSITPKADISGERFLENSTSETYTIILPPPL